MNDLLIPQRLPPLILTEAQLTAVLGPLTMGYTWGEETIADLWRCGAPDPNDNGKRIILPTKLLEWLSDVLARQGKPLSDVATVYGRLKVGLS